MPNPYYPSDHIPIACEFEWINHQNNNSNNNNDNAATTEKDILYDPLAGSSVTQSKEKNFKS